MVNTYKESTLQQLQTRYGTLKRLPHSNSLFSIGDRDDTRIYLRYSKMHSNNYAFFGLRRIDLDQLEGRNSFLCFFTDDGAAPTCVPYIDFEDVFRAAKPANDGQYKVKLLQDPTTRELILPRVGRFNVDAYIGFQSIDLSRSAVHGQQVPRLSHSQAQTLLAAIGRMKGLDVFIPSSDVRLLDWSLTAPFEPRRQLSADFGMIAPIIQEIDVIWISAGRNTLEGLFEVEHSTPIYSGLLRFNDVLLTQPSLSRFFIVSNDARRELFVRQINRPTFQQSGLSEVTSFLEYANVHQWYSRLKEPKSANT